MKVFAQLPDKTSDGEPLPLWGGDVSTIKKLLNTRRRIAATSWYASASMQGDHPYANKIRRDLKELANLVVKEESIAQALFCEKVVDEFLKRLTYLEGSPQINTFDRPKKISKLKKLFADSGIERIDLRIGA